MAILDFPASLLKAKSFRLDIVGQVISGGITQDGQQQVVNAAGGGLWALALEFPRFNRPDQIQAWRAIQYGSQGGVVEVNVSVCDIRQAPRPAYLTESLNGVPHSDGTPFSDSSLYYSESIQATLVGSSLLRATTLRMDFGSDGGVPRGGELFSMAYGDGGDRNELHVITSVSLVSGSIYDVKFVPPLRSAHSDGEVANFSHPSCTMRLATPEAMSMAIEYGRWGTGQAAFIEVLV